VHADQLEWERAIANSMSLLRRLDNRLLVYPVRLLFGGRFSDFATASQNRRIR
jgi:hypothetical protein